MDRRPARSIARAIPRPLRAGFTLLEVLVVIAIIALLLAMVLAVGPKVLQGQRISQTKGLLHALDRALDEYKIANGTFPKIKPDAYAATSSNAGVPGPDWALPGDGMNKAQNDAPYRNYPNGGGVRYARRPDAAVFLRAAMGYGEVSNIVHNMPTQFMQSTIMGGDDSPQGQTAMDATPTVLDPWSTIGWKEPWVALQSSYILYVDAANPLAQELYGRCVNARPYFISAGPDGKFGIEDEFPDLNGADTDDAKTQVEAALQDNITSYPVGPANTTPQFFSGFRR